ncbi:S24 family peptidase [Algiphilus sp.]|uniref:LexA family protein n=1 Tax=Algiphilus sp. TaxID=1872431 RepID=UPI0025BDB457|nr:S24 family peptidase [Algiphilus sp.]MCK5769493.1 hypothetical protein [Algiphilus sp.]
MGLRKDLLDKLEAERKRRGLTFTEIAHEIGATSQQLNNWFSRGGISKDHIETLWRTKPYLFATADQLVREEAASYGSKVPILTFVQAGQRHESSEYADANSAEEWISCPKAHSQNSYALRVRNDSMTAPYGKSYPEDCVIFVDPEKLSPLSGQPVIARMLDTGDLVFKLFMEEAGKKWLRPLNPQFPIITEAFEVVGTVIGKWEES